MTTDRHCVACIQRDAQISRLKRALDRVDSKLKQSPLQAINNTRAEVQDLQHKIELLHKLIERKLK